MPHPRDVIPVFACLRVLFPVALAGPWEPPDRRDCGKGITCYGCLREEDARGESLRSSGAAPPAGPPCKDCPNIVLLLTDDQDLILGGWDPMVQTKRLFQDAGATATEWRVHTPICAPSRAELMTGRYFHNIKNAAFTPPGKLCGSGAVGHLDLKGNVFPNTFMRQLRERRGYATALFGKCINGNCYNPPEMHGAVDRWFEGTGFYGGSWFDNESPGGFFKNSSYAGGYGTSIIGNKTVEWIRSLRGAQVRRPFFIYFAPHAPHSPATPAHWYKDACASTTSPRTPAFNWSTPEFHNLVSRQPPFRAKDVEEIDKLARKRCQTLLSVDDSYAEIHAAIEEAGVLNNTYFLVTSDHGYNLGHHRLPSDKFLLYEHSLRVPMVFKGPGIQPGSTTDFLGTIVDLAPTILGLAGLPTPLGMDGQSVVPLLVDSEARGVPSPVLRHLAATRTPVRTSMFFEYYSQGPWLDQGVMKDDWSNTYIGILLRDGRRNLKYGEYDPYGKQSGFSSVYMHELFDLDSDPFELYNVYNHTRQPLKDALRARTRQWYRCRGRECAELEMHAPIDSLFVV